MSIYLLVDNGSLRPAATLQLRQIAKQLGEQSNQQIHAVSLQHADKIHAEKLEDKKAVVFESFMREQLQQGETEFLILPLFFGNSAALTNFIPGKLSDLQQELKLAFECKIADVLYPLPKGDSRLVDILYDNIQKTSNQLSLPLKNIVLLDHGSPLPQITKVRNRVAEELQIKLGQNNHLDQAVMERRAGRQYDFNGGLLQDWLLEKAKQGEDSAIISLLFSLPGRHAGPDGDIVTICKSVTQDYPQFKIGISPLVGEHPLLIELLKDRFLDQNII